LNIRYGASLGGLSADEQAGFSDMQASDATTGSYLNAGAAALSAAGSYGSNQRRVPKGS